MVCGDKTFGVACDLDLGHADRHRNGLLVWWNPPLLILGGQVVDDELGKAAAVGHDAGSGSAESIGEPERAAASSSSQLSVLPGSTFEDIFGDAA